MDLGSRKKNLNALLNVEYLEADKNLLKVKKTHSHVFKRKYPTPERTHREVLWDLLSVADSETIESNRKTTDTPNLDSEEATQAALLKEKEKQKAAQEKAEEEAQAKTKKIEAAKVDLVAMDLDASPDYRRMVSIVTTLDIKTENKEKVTLITALKAYKTLLLSDAEKETLKEENEELTNELDETKDQLEETKEQLEETNSDLNETKKNETAS